MANVFITLSRLATAGDCYHLDFRPHGIALIGSYFTKNSLA